MTRCGIMGINIKKEDAHRIFLLEKVEKIKQAYYGVFGIVI